LITKFLQKPKLLIEHHINIYKQTIATLQPYAPCPSNETIYQLILCESRLLHDLRWHQSWISVAVQCAFREVENAKRNCFCVSSHFWTMAAVKTGYNFYQ